jgi:pilus assembly protein CpaE
VVADQRRIVVLSPKGGTGKTTVSTNLAVGLARQRPGQVVLVDLDVAFGDVAPALLIDARHGVVSVATGSPVVQHASGLHVVPAPDTADPMEVEATEMFEEALDEVLSRYPLAVLDTGAGFDAMTRAAVARATDIVLVASLDVPSLLALRKVLRWIDALGQIDAGRHVVVNRIGERSGIDMDDVRATLGVDGAVEIPDDPAIALAVNEGVPLTQRDERSVASAGFDQLLSAVAPELGAVYAHVGGDDHDDTDERARPWWRR